MRLSIKCLFWYLRSCAGSLSTCTIEGVRCINDYSNYLLLISLFHFIVQRCIVLDIEGTTTPISFVTDVLFPYARGNVGRHLSSTYDTPETQDDIKLLRAQVRPCFLFWTYGDIVMLIAIETFYFLFFYLLILCGKDIWVVLGSRIL